MTETLLYGFAKIPEVLFGIPGEVPHICGFPLPAGMGRSSKQILLAWAILF